MEVRALTKYARISPKKIRDITRLIQGKSAGNAQDLLKFIPRKSARLVGKTLSDAIANAENNHNLSLTNLVVKRALIEEGPSSRRFRPCSRGSAHPYKKRTSHIRIILEEVR